MNNEVPPIVCVQAGALSDEDSQRLRDAGYVVVTSLSGEVDCLKIVSGVSLPDDPLGLVNAAMRAVNHYKPSRDAFGSSVASLLELATRKKPSQ